MPVYATCCCIEDQIPCGSTGWESCAPVAILVEGVASIAASGSHEFEWGETCTCGFCGSALSYNHEKTDQFSFTKTASVSFKALLLRQGGDTYATRESEYQSRTSTYGVVQATGSYRRISDLDWCNECSGNSIFSERGIDVNPEQGDARLVNFSLRRETQFVECVPCLTSVYGDGCYEKYILQGTVLVPTTVAGRHEYELKRRRPDYLGNCNEYVAESEPFRECEEYQEIGVPIAMTRYARIRPEEAEVDVCPLDEPRALAAIATPFPAGSNDPNDPCQPCSESCTCSGIEREGMRKVAGAPPNWYEFGASIACSFPDNPNWEVRMGTAPPIRVCYARWRHGDSTTTSDSFTDSYALPCNSSVESCLAGGNNGTDYCGGDDCGETGTATSENCPKHSSATYQMDTNVSFEFTRHELLYSLPDPAVWPNV